MSGTAPSSPAQADPGVAVSGYSRDELNPSDGDTGAWKDRGCAWVVCGAAFLINFFMVGTHQSYGVLFPAFLEEFEASRASAAWAGSLAYGLLLLGGPFAGSMCKTYGPRKVAMAGSVLCFLGLLLTSIVEAFPVIFFTYGILFGLGSSLAYSPGNIVITWYFEKHRTLATGIAAAGGSFGNVALTPLLKAMVDSLGWRGAIRYFLIWQIVVGIAALAYRPLPPGAQPTQLQTFKTSPAKNYVLDLSLWRNEVFVVWTAAISLTMYGYFIPYVHLPSYAADVGVSDGPMLVLLLGAASAGSRLLLGPVLQLLVQLNRLHIQTFSMIVTAVVTLVLPACSTYGGLVTCSVLLGLFDGCFVTLLPILTVDLVGVENMSLAWGFTLGSCSVSIILGPPTAGWIRSSAQSYHPAFYVAGTIVMLGGLLLFAIPWAKRRNTLRNTDTTSLSVQFSGINISPGTDPGSQGAEERTATMPKTSSQECACSVPLSASRSIVDASVLDYVMKLEEAHIYAEEYSKMGSQAYEMQTVTPSEDLAIFGRREAAASMDVPLDVTKQTLEASEGVNSKVDVTDTTVFPTSLDVTHAFGDAELDAFPQQQQQPSVAFSSQYSPSASTTTSLCADGRLSPAFSTGNPFMEEPGQLQAEAVLLPIGIPPPAAMPAAGSFSSPTTTDILIDMSPYTTADVAGSPAIDSSSTNTEAPVVVMPDTPIVFGDTDHHLNPIRMIKSECYAKEMPEIKPRSRRSSESSASDLPVQPQPGQAVLPPPPRAHRLSEGASSPDSTSLIDADWVIVSHPSEGSVVQQQSANDNVE
ncbi:monocarboxylate transporter 10-like [Branchiostoma floridae x Branchiostoma belcheri]